MMHLSRLSRVAALSALTVVVAATLVACGKKEKNVTQTAARVDGTEITTLQLKFYLRNQRPVRPDQQAALQRRALDHLIDEQLIVDEAEKQKLDKAPAGEQALDAARRAVLERAYIEQVRFAVPAPTDETLHRFYDDNPALFANRRIYTLHEFLAKVPADQMPALKALVDGGKSHDEITAWLKAKNFPFREQEGPHAPEQLGNSLQKVAALSDGHGMMEGSGDQAHIVYLVSSQATPITYEQAKGRIAQQLSAQSSGKALELNLAALRGAAKITYSAPYESLAASQGAGITTHDIAASAPEPLASSSHISLPEADASSGVHVTLPEAASSGVQVTLPTSTNNEAVHVSLPTAGSSVHVSLPPQTSTESGKK